MAYNPKKDYEKNKKKYDYSGMFSNDDGYNPRRDYFENSDRFDYKGFNLDIKLNDLDKERKRLNSFIEGSSDRFRSDEELEKYNELSRKYRQSAMALKNEIQGEKYGAFDRDSEDYKNLIGNLDSIAKSKDNEKAIKSLEEYYGQYENEDAYNYAKKQWEKQSKLDAMSDEELAAYRDELKALEDSKSVSKNVFGLAYGTDKSKADTANKMAAASKRLQDEGVTSEEIDKMLSDREMEKYLSSLTEEDKELARDYMSKYGNALNPYGANQAYYQNQSYGKHNKEIADYFESKGLDPEKVAEYVMFEDSAKRQAERDEATKEFVNDSTGGEVLANVGAVASSPVRGFMGLQGILASSITATDRYDVNNEWNALSNFADTTKEATKGKHDWETELFGNNVDLFDKIYDFGMSSAESLTQAATGVGSVTMGLDAMTSQTKQLTEAGADRNTAILGGIVAGSFETFFEHFSIEQLNKQINARTLKEVATEFGKSIGINASEETFTEIANILYDTLANGGASEYTQLYNSYMAQGMSEDEARSQAIKDLVGQVFESGAQGGLMGGLFGGVGTGIGSVNAITEARTSGAQIKTNQEKIAAMVNNGLNAVEGSEPYKIAQRIKEKAYNEETGEYDISKIKDYEIGNLAYNLTSDTYANKIISEKEKGAEVEDKVKGVMDTYKTMAGVKENVATSKENFASVDFNKGTAVTEDGKTVDLNKTGISRSLSAFEVLTKKLSTEETNKLYSAYKSLDDKSKVSELVTAYEWAKNGGAKLKEYSNTDALQVAYNLGKEQNLVDFSQKKTKIFNPSEVVETMSAEDLKAFNDFIHKQEGMENVNVEALDDAYFDNLIKRIESGDKQAQAEADRISAATDLAKMLNDFGFNYSFSFYRTKDSDVRNGKGVNGNVNLSTGKIYVDVNAGNVGQNMILQAMAHEMIHLAKEQTPKEWNEFAKAILEETNNYTSEEYKEKGDYLKRILGETISKYQDKKGNIKMELLTDEVVAKLAEGMLTDERVFERIVETNRSLAQRIVDFLKSILKQLKAAFKGTEYASEIKYTQDVINKFVDMLNARKTVETTEVSINKNTVRDLVNAVNIADLSVKENLTDEVNKYLYDDADNLNAISDIVEKNVREEVENPDYTEVRNIVNQGRWYVPEKTRNNVKDSVGNEYSAISARLNLTSDNKATSYEIMLRELAEQNASLDFEGEEEAIIDLNEWLINNAEKYEKVTPEMAKMYAEEFIDNLKALKDGRTEDVRFSMRDSDGNTLTKEQAEFFKDSKARDEEGNLLVMYHGTGKGGFTVFDSKFSDDKLSLFFTSDKSVATSYIRSNTAHKFSAERLNVEPIKDEEAAKAFLESEGYTDINYFDEKRFGRNYKYWNFTYPETGQRARAFTNKDFIEFAEAVRKTGSVYYETYLNVTNPLVVDAKGSQWSKIKYGDKTLKIIEPVKIANYVFLNAADAKPFVDKYDLDNIQKLIKEAEEKGEVEYKGETYDQDELETLYEDNDYEFAKEYKKYRKDNAKSISFKEFYENYKDYTLYDLKSFMDEYDRNAPSFADLEDYDYAELVETFKERLEEDEWDLSDFYADVVPIKDKQFVHEKVFTTRQLAKEAKKKGHDGVIIKNLYDYGSYQKKYNSATIIIAFDSNQIKLTSNKKPTENEDIRFSKRDSEGRELTKGQQEYFKDNSPETLDKDGNLKRYYHGTDLGGFTVFNTVFSDDESSLFFSDNKEVSKTYNHLTDRTFNPDKKWTYEELEDQVYYGTNRALSVGKEDGKIYIIALQHYDVDEEFDTVEEAQEWFVDEFLANPENLDTDRPRLYEVYLSIKNPLVVDAEGKRWNQLTGWAQEHIKSFNKSNTKIDRVNNRVYLYGNGEVLASAEINDFNDDFSDNTWKDHLLSVAKMGYGIKFEGLTKTRDVATFAKERGYDSVIFNNIVDFGSSGNYVKEEPAQVIAVFNSNQIKSIYNENPTENEDIRFSMRKADEEYQYAVERNDIPMLEHLVEQAARNAGYDSPLLYHGTNRFGFTQMDLDKMDDNQSIFLTSNQNIASTYAATMLQKSISEGLTKDVFSLSPEELAEELNKYQEDGSHYEYVTKKTIEKLEKVNEKVITDGTLEKLLNSIDLAKVEEDAKHLINYLKNHINNYSAKEILEKENLRRAYVNSIMPLKWDALKVNKRIFNSLKKIESNIRKADRLKEEMTTEEGIIEDIYNEGSFFEFYKPKEAAVHLRELAGHGIYSLYAKLGKTLEIDGKGANWNSIQMPGKEYTPQQILKVLKSKGEPYKSAKLKDGKILLNGDTYELDYIKRVLNLESPFPQYLTTREISKMAKEQGYDSVVFRNIRDNGGRNEDISLAERADIYVVFNPNNIKSADTVTYDDEGNVIPLSERFKEDNNDLRFSKRDSEGNELTEKQAEYFKDSKVVDEDGDLLVMYHGTIREFYTFSKDFANAEGNLGKGFYFTNNLSDVEENYANEGGADLTNKIEREADLLEGMEEYKDKDHDEIVEMLRKKYITSEEPITLEVYLNVKNPCYIGENETYLLNEFDTGIEADIDDFEDEQEYYDEVEYATDNLIEGILEDIVEEDSAFSNYTQDIASVLWDAVYEGGMTVENMRKRLADLYIEDEEGNLADSEVLRLIIESLGYDGIIDSSVSEKFKNMHLAPDTKHVIVFDSSQVKLTTNENPTSNEDIRYSKRNSELATNRELVAGVIKQLAKNDKENKSLNSYVANIDEITKALDRVDEINLELSKSWLHRNEVEEAKALKDLTEEKEALLDKVARQDKKLMSIEATAFMKDLLTREKEKAKKRTAAKYRQYFEDYKTQKKTTVSKQAIRNRIIRQVKSVNKRLVNWTDKNNVKADIQPLMVGFVRSFLNNTSVFEKAKLADLQAAYERMAEDNSDNILLGRFYDPDTNEELIELRELLDGKRLSQLTLAEHERVADIVEHFLHVIKNYDEIFTQGKRATVESVASSWMADMSDKEHKASGLTDALEKFGYANMTPIYLFKRLGNTAYKLYNDFLDAQDRNMVLADEAHNRLNAIADKYHYYDWNKQKDTLSFVTEEGSNIELTLGQAMTLYATAKREATSPQEAKHLSHGGFVYPEKKKALKRQRTDARAHRLSEADNVRIAEWLTPEQRGFVDAIVEYMSTDMSELGNEVAMELFGITKYNEKYYFPYNVDSNTLQTSSGGVPPKQENAIKHVGFTKATVRGANKPIVIDDFFDIATNHINQMITYASWAVPLDSFNAVLNYRTTPTADTPGVYLKAEIENAYGKNMLKAINQVLVDINGGIRISEGERFANSLIGMFKSQAVLMSASVVVQQPSAIGRAFALIDGKYFFASHPSLKAWEECKEYCPVARIKEIGKYDTYTGKSMADYIKSRDLKGKEFVKALFEKDNSARQDLMGIAPQYADLITWSHIWNAVKAEVRDKQGLSGEELRQAAAVRFREVINLTQVYDSTLAKSSWMRSKSGYMKMITAFGAEPTLSFNLLLDGILSKKAKVASRAIGSFVLSVAFNALLKSIITAARDDDDDKTYLEKYIGNLFGNFLDDVNPASLVPIFRDVVSLLQGYDVNRADMEAISMFIDMVKTVADSDKGWEKKIAAIMDGAGVAFGVPVRNVRRDVKALINVINSSPISETTLKGVDESIKEELRMDTSLKSTYEKMLDSGSVEKYAEDIEYQYLKKLKNAKGSSQAEKAKNARSSIKTSATSYFLGEYKKAYAEGNTDRCNEILSVVRQIKVAGIRLYDSGFEKTWKKKAQEAMSEE